MSDILKQLRDPSVFAVSRKETADYIEELEAKLAKAVGALKHIANYECVGDAARCGSKAALAELTGESNE